MATADYFIDMLPHGRLITIFTTCMRILVLRLILRQVLKTCALGISLTFLAVQYLSPCLSKVILIYCLILNALRIRL